ncbi:MAG: oligosaccharide flippase family protein [Bacilli bacterium]|nr:oligosaccharide flippase family protein [Bacilli bacterium]
MKEKFIKSTIILMIGGIFTKILGMISKIFLTRYLGTEGIGIYMLILPSFILFLNLASFGFPVSISKMVASLEKNNKRLIFTSLFFVMFINILLIIFIIMFSKTLAVKLLHNVNCTIPIMSIALVLPFTSVSSIIRSYFFGKEKMIPHILSNILEDVVRILLIMILIKKFSYLDLKYQVTLVILINIICELVSIFILFLFLPKNFVITKRDIYPSKIYLKESLSISVPNTMTRLVTSVCYFFEPIILTNTLHLVGYTSHYITYEYGIMSGYSIPIVLLPSFFTLAISQALLPVISREYSRKNYVGAKKKVKLAIFYSLCIGIFFTIIFEIFPKNILKFLYNTTEGHTYIRLLAPICLLQYIQAPLSSVLDATDMSKENFVSNTIGSLIRIIFLPLFSLLKIGLYGLILSTSLNIIVVTFMNIYQVKKKLK